MGKRGGFKRPSTFKSAVRGYDMKFESSRIEKNAKKYILDEKAKTNDILRESSLGVNDLRSLKTNTKGPINIELTILGDPVPYKRERINMRAVSRWLRVKMKGNPYRFGPLTYTPSECTTWRKRIQKGLPHKPMLKGKISVWVTWYRAKDWKDSIHYLRPDGDNIIKNLFDALQDAIFLDDAYIIEHHLLQQFSSKIPRLKVIIRTQGVKTKPVKWIVAPLPSKDLQNKIKLIKGAIQ